MWLKYIYRDIDVGDILLISTHANRIEEYQRWRSPLCRVHTHTLSDFESTETKIFRAGLKHYSGNEERLIKGKRSSPNQDYHDAIDYERVHISTFRDVLYTHVLRLTNISTSTICTVDLKNSLWTATWWERFIATVSV